MVFHGFFLPVLVGWAGWVSSYIQPYPFEITYMKGIWKYADWVLPTSRWDGSKAIEIHGKTHLDTFGHSSLFVPVWNHRHWFPYAFNGFSKSKRTPHWTSIVRYHKCKPAKQVRINFISWRSWPYINLYSHCWVYHTYYSERLMYPLMTMGELGACTAHFQAQTWRWPESALSQRSLLIYHGKSYPNGGFHIQTDSIDDSGAIQ